MGARYARGARLIENQRLHLITLRLPAMPPPRQLTGLQIGDTNGHRLGIVGPDLPDNLSTWIGSVPIPIEVQHRSRIVGIGDPHRRGPLEGDAADEAAEVLKTDGLWRG